MATDQLARILAMDALQHGNGDSYTKEQIDSKLNRKVDSDKVEELFTAAEKQKLAALLPEEYVTHSEFDTMQSQMTEIGNLVSANTSAVGETIADVLHLGVGEIIQNYSDLNAYTTPGVYRTAGSAATATLSNCPVDIKSAIRLEVSLTTIVDSANVADGVIQKIFPNAITGSFYMRTKSTSRGWGVWYRYDGVAAESNTQETQMEASLLQE